MNIDIWYGNGIRIQTAPCWMLFRIPLNWLCKSIFVEFWMTQYVLFFSKRKFASSSNLPQKKRLDWKQHQKKMWKMNWI